MRTARVGAAGRMAAAWALGLALSGWPGPGSAQPPPPAPGATAAAPARPGAARLADAKRVRERLGISPAYDRVSGVEAVKVAVLDYGFAGLEGERPYLPANAEVVEHYDPEFVRRFGLGDPDYRKGFEPGNAHGRQMAQIVWGVTGNRPGGPKFYLLNANGPTMLRRAVRYAIEQRVDIILFSGSFEGGGNGDGRGFINRIAAEALARDILWINAAGNYGRRVYAGPVRVLADGYLRLRDGSDIASLRFHNKVDENAVTVTLTWNDYRDAEDAGTDKDLDLYVEDWAGRPVGSSEKVQVSRDGEIGPDESRNPRERVVLEDLPANPVVASAPDDHAYRIRIKAKGSGWTAADRVRVLVTAAREAYVPPGSEDPADALVFIDATGAEELFPPADNPLVLTVGDASPVSSIGPTADRRVKPDILLPNSRADFTDGTTTAGSSNAAAYVAGVAAVLRATQPALRPRHLLRLAREGGAGSTSASTSASGSARPATARPTPISSGAARPKGPARPPAYLERRLWRTPGPARVAEVVREDR